MYYINECNFQKGIANGRTRNSSLDKYEKELYERAVHVHELPKKQKYKRYVLYDEQVYNKILRTEIY